MVGIIPINNSVYKSLYMYTNKYPHMDSMVISVRVKKELKHKLEREGIDVEKAVKDYLNQRAAQIELRRSIGRLKEIIAKNVKPSKKGFAVRQTFLGLGD